MHGKSIGENKTLQINCFCTGIKQHRPALRGSSDLLGLPHAAEAAETAAMRAAAFASALRCNMDSRESAAC